MKNEVKYLLNDHKFVINNLFFKTIKNLNLSINEIILLVFFDNAIDKTFNPKVITDHTGLNENEVLEAFNNLMTNKLITLIQCKDINGKLVEEICLEYFYIKQNEIINKVATEEVKSDIFENFEREFGRTISPMEYEIINAWLGAGVSEELILGALKEAVYNGAKSFRYIDKIIFDWQGKGFKSMSDVKTYFTKNKKSEKSPELFDYNWLEENTND